MADRVYRNCQSCGMPLKRDQAGGGTNADGSRSTVYCSHCYRDGSFVDPGMTVDDMKALVRRKLVEKGFPSFIAGFFAYGIPKLARWQK